MKNVKKQILFILTFIAMLIISNKVYAASASITPTSVNVTTGTTVNITVGVQSTETWNLKLTTSGGTLGGTTTNADAGDGEVTQTVMSATFSASTPGSYTITLSGTIASSADVNNRVTQPVNKTATITVTAPVSTPTPSTQASPTTNPTATTTSFTSVNETVYATTDVNVRSSYSTSASSLGQLKKGESVTRIGVSTSKVNGYNWSKVTYNGKTAYIASSFLTTTKPETPATAEPSTPPSTAPEEKSSDATLKSLSIAGVELIPAFDSTITSYTANIEEDIEEVEVLVETNSDKATYEIIGNTALQNGENIVTVVVTAEDGAVVNYEIKLTKNGEIDPFLYALAITGIKENDERVDITLPDTTIVDGIAEYTINLNEYMKSIEILANLNDENIVYEGIGTFDLVVGENKFTVTLKMPQEDAEEKIVEYRITINNPEKVVVEENNETNYMLIIIIVAIVVITLLVITLLIVHYRKQHKVEYAEPDYSFLKNDEEIQNKEQEREKQREQEKNNELDDNNGEKRKGGKHF